MDSSNLSAMHALEYHFRCNSTSVCDYAHGANRTSNGTLQAAELQDMRTRMVVCWNVPHSRPEDEQARFLQLQVAMVDLLV